MIPRIHRRGNSFKGALGYILHDPGKDSSERVAWVLTQNIYSQPEQAWFEMFETYRNRTVLKQNAGFDPRGRDNRTPVLHYTLAWHATDKPEAEHMKAMAIDSLKALGLSEHEAVIACHSDKEHHHVHVVVNTVHPYTGKTAPLKFSKLEFSRWAEAYEREHGIHCEERIKNNERRREIADRRKAERDQAAFALLTGKEPPEPSPFEPVNDNSPNRRRWFERKEVVDRMKALRAAVDLQHKEERSSTWTRHEGERGALEAQTHSAMDDMRTQMRADYKPQWKHLYQHQRREERHVREVATHPLERAVFLFKNRARLGNGGKPLGLRQMIPYIVSGKKLKSRVEQIHMRERRALARDEKTRTKQYSEALWASHRAAFHTLRDRQAAERAAEKAHQNLERKDVTFARAKAELIRDADHLAANVPKAPKGPWRGSRLEQTAKPEAPPASAPNAPQRPKQDARNALTGDQQRVARGVPGAPAKPTPTPVPQPKQQPTPPARMSKSFEEAVRPGTPSAKEDFNRAADPDVQKKAEAEKARREQMQKDLEKLRRRRPRDDFERER
jgi:hypothetical protein